MTNKMVNDMQNGPDRDNVMCFTHNSYGSTKSTWARKNARKFSLTKINSNITIQTKL